MTEKTKDLWARWLLRNRFGAFPEEEARRMFLHPVRDAILSMAGISPGNLVLDIGCGDGLIAFGALPLVGEHGQVIFSDVSQDLLDHCQSLAELSGELPRCQFIQADAQNLHVLPDASVDVITMRSVLIYVQEKQAAFNEFYRVLRPGGRLSVFEPLYRFGSALSSFGSADAFYGYEVADKRMELIVEKLRQRLSRPVEMVFNEDDVLLYVKAAGFRSVSCTKQMQYLPHIDAIPWEVFLETQDSPLLPTIKEAMQQVLTRSEREELETYLRPVVESGQGYSMGSEIYLQATR